MSRMEEKRRSAYVVQTEVVGAEENWLSQRWK